MKRLLLAVALLAPVLALAAEGDGPKFSGYLWQGNHDSTYFVVRPQSNNESWWFKIPDGEYFWCKTNDAEGTELEDTDLSDHKSITLKGAMGDKVTFIVYEIAGNGAWSAWKGTGASSADDEVSFGGSSSDVSTDGELVASGSLPKGESSTFAYEASADDENLVFTWPSGASFWVKVFGSSGKQLGDYDLNEGETINLTGGGKFTLKIYSKSGSGAWTARKGE
jgi:hypothetical protein